MAFWDFYLAMNQLLLSNRAYSTILEIQDM